MLQQKFYLQREENCVLQDTSMTMSDQIELSALGTLANLGLWKKKKEIDTPTGPERNTEKVDKTKLKAKMYLNVPIVLTDDTPKELAVGAIDVNPNTPERITST